MRSAILSNKSYPTTAIHRWLLACVMLIVLALGWKYPLLGFVVLAAMLTGMFGGARRGRYVCGNLCPRGSFFDTFFAKFGPKRPIPEKLFGMSLRWTIMAGLMSFMTFRLTQNPGSLNHWGLVFWQTCLVTTAVALVLGVFFRPRTWCSICPVGTVGSALGGHKLQLNISSACRSCGICSSNCPMGHQIPAFKEQGMMKDPDCLQCSVCVNLCPTAALSLQPSASQALPIISEDEQEELQQAA